MISPSGEALISPSGEALGLGRIRGVELIFGGGLTRGVGLTFGGGGLTRGIGLMVWAIPGIAMIANVKVAKTIVIVFVDLIGAPFFG